MVPHDLPPRPFPRGRNTRKPLPRAIARTEAPVRAKLTGLRKLLDAIEPDECEVCRPRPPVVVERYANDPPDEWTPPACLNPGRCGGGRQVHRVVIEHVGANLTEV